MAFRGLIRVVSAGVLPKCRTVLLTECRGQIVGASNKPRPPILAAPWTKIFNKGNCLGEFASDLDADAPELGFALGMLLYA